MSKINVTNLELKLVQKMNATTNTQDMLALSAAVKQLRNGAVYVVQSYAQLPSDSSAVGELWFVVDDRILYTSYANPPGWYPLVEDTLNVLLMVGDNTFGGLATGDVAPRTVPGPTVDGSKNWCQAVSLFRSGAGIKTDGTLWTWGDGNAGILGDGTTVARSSPGTTIAGGNTWCFADALSAGTSQCLNVLKADGTIWRWGAFSCSPTTISGGGTDWCQVAGSHYVAAAVKTDGTLWTWGTNTCGELGRNNTGTTNASPDTTVGGGNTWCVSGTRGFRNASAIKTDGTLWTWGDNGRGQLGDGSVINRSSPGTTSGGGTTWCSVSGGFQHSAAIKTDGTLWTWGYARDGSLGVGDLINSSSPRTTVGGGTTWCKINSGVYNTAALKTDGTLWTWGRNFCGNLGDGTISNRSSPGTTLSGGNTWCDVSLSVQVFAAIQSKIIG